MRLTVVDADSVMLPGAKVSWTDRLADCNSPGHWTGDRLVVFSSAVHPWRAYGPSVAELGESSPVIFDRESNGGRWIEATWKSPQGRLYGWYHNEPDLPIFNDVNLGRTQRLTAPRIGACRSDDDGCHWQDLGIILEVAADTYIPETRNYFFGGGNGDFCVLQEGDWLYFAMGLYNRRLNEQGIGWARLPIDRLDDQRGEAQKWYRGSWSEPGLGGIASPTMPVAGDWHGPSPDAFWGPSIHWNRHLERYVMLMNRAVDSHWRQEGIYASFAETLTDPTGWSKPEKILDGGSWYPVVYGNEVGDTDKFAGSRARLFMGAESSYEILFDR